MPEVVRLVCSRCDVTVSVPLEESRELSATMRQFFDEHLSGDALIDISAVERAGLVS